MTIEAIDFCLPVNNRQNVPSVKVPSVTITTFTDCCPCYMEEGECPFQ